MQYLILGFLGVAGAIFVGNLAHKMYSIGYLNGTMFLGLITLLLIKSGIEYVVVYFKKSREKEMITTPKYK